MSASPIVVVREYRSKRSRDALWSIVSDTDDLNREAKLEPVEFGAFGSDGSHRQLVKTRVGPLAIAFWEHPFEWRQPTGFSVRRDYVSGPVERVDVRFDLEDDGAGSRLRVEIEGTPRWKLARPVAKSIMNTSADQLIGAVRRLDEGSVSTADLSATARTRLDRVATELQGLLGNELMPLSDRLVGFVGEAPNAALAHLRPFALADAWDVRRRALLEVFLHGVAVGLFELGWELICPSCRTSSARVPDLSDIEAHAHCGLCDLTFGTDLDRAVEASFRPAEAIRPERAVRYCTGGPAATPHVVSQINVEAADEATIELPQEAGRYRLFVRGGRSVAVEVADDADEETSLELNGSASAVRGRAGGRLTVQGAKGVGHLKLERVEWASQAVTVADLGTITAFRRTFSEQLLRPGLTFKARKVALLFSDLSASTMLYTREGDAAAFRLVQDHFELLERCIEEVGGAVVKTIGDAVMASFEDELDALQAGAAMQRRFVEFREDHPQSEGVFLKIGVYAGACYVVNANGVLDYFGQTVNVAARLQGKADDREIVIEQALLARAVKHGVIDESVQRRSAEATLKGIDGAMQVVHLSGFAGEEVG